MNLNCVQFVVLNKPATLYLFKLSSAGKDIKILGIATSTNFNTQVISHSSDQVLNYSKDFLRSQQKLPLSIFFPASINRTTRGGNFEINNACHRQSVSYISYVTTARRYFNAMKC